MKLNIDDLGVVGIVVDDWDITKSFKPKTITTDYSSWIAYISRRAVPAGTPITDTYYWKPLTRLQVDLALDYNNFKDAITKEFDRLEQLVASFLKSTEAGVAVTDSFGNDSLIAVSQRAQTIAFNKIWDKLEAITGEFLQGINMVVSPTFYIGEHGCPVNIIARPVDANGMFDHIAFYAETNGERRLIAEADNVEDEFVANDTITGDTYIICEATIMGIPYTRSQLVKHFDSFYMGAAKNYNAIMDEQHTVSIVDNSRITISVACKEGDNIFIITTPELRSALIRVDMNGFEIPFDEEQITIDEEQYCVLTSKNVYIAGEYNIDING